MGVKGLYKKIAIHAPDSIKTSNDINDLIGKNKVVAIDAMIYIHRWTSARVQYQGVLINHIQGMLYMTLSMIESKVIPLWLFDGPVHRMKRVTVDKRKAHGRYDHIPSGINLVSECIELLTTLHVPYIVCDGDAEAYGAKLVRSKVAYAVMTYDSDALMFGATRVIRGNGGHNSPHTMISLNRVLQGMGYSTMKQFVDYCIGLGTDYKSVDGGDVTYQDIKDIVELSGPIPDKPITLPLITLSNRQKSVMKRRIKTILTRIGMPDNKQDNVMNRLDAIILISV